MQNLFKIWLRTIFEEVEITFDSRHGITEFRHYVCAWNEKIMTIE